VAKWGTPKKYLKKEIIADFASIIVLIFFLLSQFNNSSLIQDELWSQE